MPRRIESPELTGPAGRLEALLEEPEDRDPLFAALVCHPHPQHGGTMHNKVVHRTARGLRTAGGVCLRFNYRGVNLSEGTYDHGVGETEDARAALALLRGRYPELPYLIAGFSFGSRIALTLAGQAEGCRGAIAIGFPTRYRDYPRFAESPVPRVFVQSTNDEFGPRAELEPWLASLGPGVEAVWIESVDHFFRGGLEAFENAIVALPGHLRVTAG